MDSGNGILAAGGTAKPIADEPEYHSTAIQEGLQEMRAGLFNLVAFWQTFTLLWKKPELAVHDPQKQLQVTPLTFSVQAVVLLFLITGMVGSFADAFLDISNFDTVGYRQETRRLDAMTAAARTPEEKTAAEHAQRHYELTVKANTLGSNAAKAMTAPAYLAGAWFFGWFLRRWRGKYPRIAAADRAFLYDLTKRVFLPSVIMMVGVALFLLLERAMPDIVGSKIKLLLILTMSVICLVSALWGFGNYVVSCRRLIALFGIPPYSWRKGEGDNQAHQAVACGFSVAICLIMGTSFLVQAGVSTIYLMIRHA